MDLIDKSLSEPYSVFTYRYFLHQWPNLCYLAFDGDKPIGVVVCKMDDHRGHLRGYIAMLVVDNTYRGKGLGGWVCSSGLAQCGVAYSTQGWQRHLLLAGASTP